MSGFGDSARAEFKYTFQISPITLIGGIAQSISGSGLPIVSLTYPQGFPQGILGEGITIEESDDIPVWFQPLSGLEVINNDISEQPLANQAVAGNAIITKPLSFSMLMFIACSGAFPYSAKFSMMGSLIATLKRHNLLGGMYTVATPSLYITPCVMRSFHDASEGANLQPQSRWQMDFFRPLLTLEEAQSTQNALMSKLSGGQQIQGQPAWSGASATAGQFNPLVTPSIIPGARSAGGAGAGPASPPLPAPNIGI